MNSIITRIGAVATTMKKTLTDYVTAKDIANWAVTKAQMHVYEFYEDKERRKQENPYAFMFSLDGMDRTFKTREKVERTVMIAEGYRILRMAGWIAGISFLTTTHKPDNELYAYICASAATVEFAAAYAMHIGQRKVAPFVERMRKKHGRKTIDNIFTDDINDTFNAFYNAFGFRSGASGNKKSNDRTTRVTGNGMTDTHAYAVLGLSHTASKDDIKSAYRRIARETHPDHNQGNKNKEAQFRQAAEAYNFLTRQTGQRQAVN